MVLRYVVYCPPAGEIVYVNAETCLRIKAEKVHTSKAEKLGECPIRPKTHHYGGTLYSDGRKYYIVKR